MTQDSPEQARLSVLRERLAELDRTVLEIAAQRQAVATEIGRIKAAAELPTRDYAQEKEVIDRARRVAASLNLSGDLAEQVVLLLIRASLTAQEQDRIQSAGARTVAGHHTLFQSGETPLGPADRLGRLD
jgi:chorismate mutase/prephenate dehydrogenase